LILLFLTTLFAQNSLIEQKYSQSKNCAGCHPEQAKDWKTTWHAKSHTTQNSLYKKTLEYMSKKLYKDSQKLSIECAKCHNPRISVKKVNKAFILSKAFGAKNKEVEKIDHALNRNYLKEGINCIVCHNIDKIEHTTDLSKRGFDAVKWGKNHIMVGSFDSNRTSFHKSVKREHFNKDVNRLCFVCHFGGENLHKLPVYTTGKEFQKYQDSEKCVDCHMSVRKEGIIAANILKKGEKAKTRELRSHLFAGVRNSDIAEDAFDLNVSDNGSYILVSLHNKTPHKVPTGYGGRTLRVEVNYFNGDKKIESIYRDLDVLYLDENKKVTIPYLAKSIEKDLRLKPYESRKIPFIIPKSTTDVEVTVWYQLVNDNLKKLLNIEDKTFTKMYKITSQNIKIRPKE
jgi:nitrate/TMAO reductase-like tetraheme cytochrome c subunit